MRCLVVALTAVALLTMPAHAQGSRKHQPQDNMPADKKEQPKVNEKDYKSALDRIPASDQKVDPWQNVREAPKPK
jgi:hypothetical protein